MNGAPILASELDQRAAGRLARLRQEEYEVRREVLDELVAERLVAAEAAKRKVSPEELLRLEVDAKAEALPAEQLELIYRQNAERFAGQPRDQALARIRSVLGDRAKAERRAAYQSELRKAARVAVRLDAPRVAIEIPPGAPSTGPADAPVTIVEFTDYQCPYCHRAQGVIDQVLARYPGKVRLVHMEFPLDGHPEAVPAARAARCAGEQGKFWEFHRSLMTAPGPLDAADLKAPRRLPPAEPRPVRELPGVGPPRRGHPGLSRAGRGPGRHRHPRLLHQRPHALRRPPPRVLHRGDRRGALHPLVPTRVKRRPRPVNSLWTSDRQADPHTHHRRPYTVRTARAQEVVRQVAD